MNQHTILAEGISIVYIEQNAELKKTVFFVHGNSLSLNMWYKQFASALFFNYRLIAFDLPAHGQSGASDRPDNDYSVIALGRITASVLNQLSNNKPYVLVGLSLGSNVVAEMLDYQLGVVGIVLIASCVFGGEITVDRLALPGVDLAAAYTDKPDAKLLKTYFEALCTSQDVNDQQMIREDYFAVNAPFRSSLLQSIIKGEYSDEIALLQKQQIPLLLVFGQEEQLLNINYLDGAGLPLWKNEIFKIPGAGHLTNIDQPEVFSQLLANYLDSCFNE